MLDPASIIPGQQRAIEIVVVINSMSVAKMIVKGKFV
jgi:hypothetical protein